MFCHVVHINSWGYFISKQPRPPKKSYVVSQKELIEGVLSKASKFKKERKKWTRCLGVSEVVGGTKGRGRGI